MITLSQALNAIGVRQEIINLDELQGIELTLTGVADLKTATPSSIAFIAQPKYLNDLNGKINAGALIVSQKFADTVRTQLADGVMIVVKDAYLAYACVSVLFAPMVGNGIHQTAIIDPSVKLGERVHIGAYAIIGADAVIGDDVSIGAGTSIGDGVAIGNGSVIDTQVNIAHQCVIGQNVRIHSHASIGSEGFGFAPAVTAQGLQWQRIAQLGRVVIGDRCRIGSNTCIDRGAVGDTVLGDDVIIDNLVQIAHNVQIGASTAIAAKVGIAGSTKIGKNCIIGGAAGISGHLQICDGVTITAMSMVTNDIKQAGSYSSGTVAMPSADWRRAAVRFRQMGNKNIT